MNQSQAQWWHIPLTVPAVGAMLVAVAYVVMLVLPKWSKFAIVAVILGSFGVVGEATGWWGRLMANIASHLGNATAGFMTKAFGYGSPLLIFIVIALFAGRGIGKGGKGTASKGKAVTTKIKDTTKLTTFALVGAGLATIPGLYALVSEVVRGGGELFGVFTW